MKTVHSPLAMAPILEQNVSNIIRAAKHILLLTDERIDGDTVGSTLGLYHSLKATGKDLTVYSPKPIPAQFNFMPAIEVIRTDDLVFADASVDLIIICDCSDGIYIQQKLPLMPRKVPLVMFDHHSTNPRFGTYNFVEPGAASTADVVWRFLTHNNFPLNQDAAQCLLTGICTDTSLFSTSNTTTASLEAAVELTKLGAKLHSIISHTLLNRPVPILRIWGLMFERLHYNEEFDALCTVLTRQDLEEFGNPELDTSSISNFLNASLDHADAILILREGEDGSVKGSMRSRGRDVAAVAERYGGGGHKQAAGFKIANARLQEKNGVWSIVHVATLPIPAASGVNVNFLKET